LSAHVSSQLSAGLCGAQHRPSLWPRPARSLLCRTALAVSTTLDKVGKRLKRMIDVQNNGLL